MLATAMWVLGFPIFNGLWAYFCAYSGWTVAVAVIMTIAIVLSYLIAPITVADDPSELNQSTDDDGEGDNDVPKLPDEDAATDSVGRARMRCAAYTALTIQLGLGLSALFNFDTLYTDSATLHLQPHSLQEGTRPSLVCRVA